MEECKQRIKINLLCQGGFTMSSWHEINVESLLYKLGEISDQLKSIDTELYNQREQLEIRNRLLEKQNDLLLNIVQELRNNK